MASKAHAVSESELMALKTIYSLAVQKCKAKQQAIRPGGPDDPEGRSNDVRTPANVR